MNIKKKESLFVILVALLTLRFLRESKKCIKLLLVFYNLNTLLSCFFNFKLAFVF